MEKQTKLFEVILPPANMLEKELEDVLGGMGACGLNKCSVNFGDCNQNTCKMNGISCIINECDILCPEGYRWDGDCGCVPVE